MQTQKRVIAAGKEQEDIKKLWSAFLIVVDDVCDDPGLQSRQERTFCTSSHCRGRHARFSVICEHPEVPQR